jgi:UDP-N-acetylglucosamine 4-epimerase
MKILVTGGAGFIGSNLVESLLNNPKVGLVRVLDNLATGHLRNIHEFMDNSKFEFLEGDIRDKEICIKAATGIDAISHQAALGSVPRSIKDPITSHDVNVNGFLNLLEAAKVNNVKRVVYASSSSVYGDLNESPKVEKRVGKVLSPYAATKMTNELYAEAYAKNYDMQIIGFRYFNVFGPKQDPEGPYAAVIPLFISAIRSNQPVHINGDGLQTRDFTYVENAVQANIRALFPKRNDAMGKVYNVAVGERVTVLKMYEMLCELGGVAPQAIHRAEREGDIRDSLANISSGGEYLGYNPGVRMEEGLRRTFNWFLNNQ